MSHFALFVFDTHTYIYIYVRRVRSAGHEYIYIGSVCDMVIYLISMPFESILSLSFSLVGKSSCALCKFTGFESLRCLIYDLFRGIRSSMLQ